MTFNSINLRNFFLEIRVTKLKSLLFCSQHRFILRVTRPTCRLRTAIYRSPGVPKENAPKTSSLESKKFPFFLLVSDYDDRQKRNISFLVWRDYENFLHNLEDSKYLENSWMMHGSWCRCLLIQSLSEIGVWVTDRSTGRVASTNYF